MTTNSTEYMRDWRSKNLEKIRQYRIEEHRHLRMEVLIAYGGKCACCGEWRYEFLSLDHIDGGGGIQKRELGNTQLIYRWVRRNGYPAGFRVLCHNCNQSQGAYGYCPHEEEGSSQT